MALAVPTFDNTVITFDTLDFTFDGADLINGGGTSIPHKPGIQGGLAYTRDVPIFVQYQGGLPLGNGPSRPFAANVTPAPTFFPVAGAYVGVQVVTLLAPGATIYYTTNGSIPTTASSVYSVPLSVGATETIKAIALLPGFGYALSAVASSLYTITLLPAATPTFSPVAGTYTSVQSVTISDSTPASTIYYTTDGSTPTTGSTVYTTPVPVLVSGTLKAIATAAGFASSAVGSAAYTISITIPNRMGGLMSAGGGGSYSSELFPSFKNRYREGYLVAGGIPDPVTGWPSNAHSFILYGGSTIPTWASGTFKCGFIGAGTPSNFQNTTVSNIVLGNGTTTYTTFDLVATAANFGYSNSAAAKNCFAYLPTYPGSAVDDPTNPNAVTNEAALLYSGLRHIRTEWHGVALWNSQLMTQANRNTPSNTQSFHQTNQWFGNQTATLGSLPVLGATSSTLVGWARGAGTWCLTFNESGSFEGRICTVGAGANPTITWNAGRGLTANVTSTTVTYGTEGFPIEWMLAIAVAANTGLVICEPTFQDGTNNVAGSYTTGTLALINSYITTYPAWTGPVLLTPGNENWNGTYNSFRVFTESAALGGFASRQTYGGAWMHALANLGRAQFGSSWGQNQRVGAVLEWQDGQPGQFFTTLDYMQNTLGVTPSADIAFIATAPYMNPAGLSGASTIANIVAAVAAKAATQAASSKLENVVIMGLHYGIPHMTYEGAPQWNSGGYSGVTNLPAAIMDATYSAPIELYYNNLSNSGAQAFSHTTLGANALLTPGTGAAGELGNISAITRANTPNWEALMSVATSNPTFTRNVINGSGSIILGGSYADQTGAANPGFPSGTFSTINGSPYFTLQGYIGYFFNSTFAQTYSLVLTMAGTGTPATAVEIGGLAGSSIQIATFTLAAGANAVGSVSIPKGPGYILFGKGTAQSTLTITSHQYN